MSFVPLSREVLSRILEKLVWQLRERLEDKGISVELSEETLDLLLKEGVSDKFGARELERVFDRRVTSPLARGIVDGTIDSNTRVEVSVTDGEIVLD